MFHSAVLTFGAEYVSKNTLSTVLVTWCCMLTFVAYYYLQNHYKYWTKKGIKGPKPLPFLGNFLIFLNKNRLADEVKYLKQYGKVIGTFEGFGPRLIIADPELLVQICVKDFDVFPNHELAEFSSKYAHKTLIRLKDNQWKRTRTLMSPTFTSGKIKRMFRFMDKCADDLIQCVDEQFKSPDNYAIIDVKETYNLYTMDTITTCCYGLKLERGNSSNLKAAASRNEFIAKAMKMFEVPILRTIIMVIFGEKLLNLINFKVTPDCDIDPIGNIVKRLISQRRDKTVQKSGKFEDYLQSLIDARLSDQMELNDLDSKESHHVGLTRESMLMNQEEMIRELGGLEEAKKVTLTDEEIVANAIFLLAVGIETTSSLLANCTYALAYHPEIQERLYEELRSIAKIGENGEKKYSFDYDSLTSCRYLDAVISETLRRLTPVVMLDRISSSDYYIEKYKIHLPKGSQIYLGYHIVHSDPDYWHEPDRFDPERFMPGNREKIVPGSYCPFGLGPRHCIGMRFSLTEAKLALAKMLMRYKFEQAPGTIWPPKHKLVLAVCNYKDPYVMVKNRI